MAAQSGYVPVNPGLAGAGQVDPSDLYGGFGTAESFLQGLMSGNNPALSKYLDIMGSQMTRNVGQGVAQALSKAGASQGGLGSQSVMLGGQAANQAALDAAMLEQQAILQSMTSAAPIAAQMALGRGNLALGAGRLGLEGATAAQQAAFESERLGLGRQMAYQDAQNQLIQQLMGYGAIPRGLEQGQLDANREEWIRQQNAFWDTYRLAMGMPPAQQSSGGGGPNMALTGQGAGMMGAGIYNLLFGGGSGPEYREVYGGGALR